MDSLFYFWTQTYTILHESIVLCIQLQSARDQMHFELKSASAVQSYSMLLIILNHTGNMLHVENSIGYTLTWLTNGRMESKPRYISRVSVIQ
jgi:hypothetical protein